MLAIPPGPAQANTEVLKVCLLWKAEQDVLLGPRQGICISCPRCCSIACMLLATACSAAGTDRKHLTVQTTEQDAAQRVKSLRMQNACCSAWSCKGKLRSTEFTRSVGYNVIQSIVLKLQYAKMFRIPAGLPERVKQKLQQSVKAVPHISRSQQS